MYSRFCITVYKVLPTNLPQNHVGRLIRIQTPNLLNHSLWGQALGISILNPLSRRFFHKLKYENHCIYFAIFGLSLNYEFDYYCLYCLVVTENHLFIQ